MERRFAVWEEKTDDVTAWFHAVPWGGKLLARTTVCGLGVTDTGLRKSDDFVNSRLPEMRCPRCVVAVGESLEADA
jgi:hypothetical protein